MEKIQANEVKFDIIQLLRDNQLDTKPNVAKFLQNHVRSIRLSISNGKVQCWPTMDYQISKVFVKFLDGHELIYYVTQIIKNLPKYYFFDDLEELELKPRDMLLVEEFFEALAKFKFIPLQAKEEQTGESPVAELAL